MTWLLKRKGCLVVLALYMPLYDFHNLHSCSLNCVGPPLMESRTPRWMTSAALSWFVTCTLNHNEYFCVMLLLCAMLSLELSFKEHMMSSVLSHMKCVGKKNKNLLLKKFFGLTFFLWLSFANGNSAFWSCWQLLLVSFL